MKETNYWQQFLSTGSIEDYLHFKNVQMENGEASERKSMGEYPDAGIYYRYGNYIEDSPYRGVR